MDPAALNFTFGPAMLPGLPQDEENPMRDGDVLQLELRSQRLTRDERGRNCWQVLTEASAVPAAKTALLLCDVWDDHHCRGAVERLEAMLPRMNKLVNAARAMGVRIIHAPSDTMDFYADSPARRRIQQMERVEPPADIEHPDPPQPVDSSDGGSDSADTGTRPWTRQHPAIDVDQERDVISDVGREVYSYLSHEGIELLLIMGVHTNMCVLGRSFAIKQMVRWGMPVALVRDLTDTQYNPAMPPYVSHEEGTRLVVEFIEKFWCPTVTGDQIV
jgi:nicotinamidase-related amidase